MENTQITEYGKYTIGKEYQKSNFGAIFRLDTYTSNRDFEQHTEHTRCVNTTDRSFVYRGNRTPDKCYYCYVNAAHSEEYHIKNTQN